MEQTFLVEGKKSMLEVLKSDFEIEHLYVSPAIFDAYKHLLQIPQLDIVDESEISRVSSLKTNRTALALVRMKPNLEIIADDGLFLVLDDVNDPGNLGTIIRIADWYGVRGIIASLSTTDLYNPKVISSSKGSFTRVPVYYTDLEVFLANASIPIISAEMTGESVHEATFPENLLLLMGNESHGVSPVLKSFVNQTITIPRYGHAESLNVGVATAVICDRIRASS